jgi:hypothetical protein
MGFTLIKAVPKFLAVCMLVSPLLFACTSRPSIPVTIASDVTPPVHIRHILVTPFLDVAEIFGPGVGVRGPLSDKVFVTAATDPLAADFLTSDLMQSLYLQLPEYQITLSDPVFDPKTLLGAEEDTERIAMLNAGRQQSADAVLAGFLYDYQDREGGDLGVRVPSRVAFELNLVDVASGRLLWHRQYEEIQRPLNENLLLLPQFIRRGGRWISAREMARDAMQKMLNTIPTILETD